MRKYSIPRPVCAAVTGILAAGTLAAPGHAQQQTPAPTPVIQSGNISLYASDLPVKTATATSLRCHVTLTQMSGSGQMVPLQTQTMELTRKGGVVSQVRIDAVTNNALAKPSPTATPQDTHQEVFLYKNGEDSIEFDADTNQYVKRDKKWGLASHWVRVAEEDVDFANGRITAMEQPTHSQETVDGRQMDVYTFVLVKTKTGEPGFVGKYYIDSATGYPYRKSYYVQDKKYYFAPAQIAGLKADGPVEYMRRQFSDWEINPTITPERFAYAPPATAKGVVQPAPTAVADKPTILLKAGADAPDFTCVGADGKDVKLSDFRGRTVILDFWATWCGPCQASMPHLERVYKATKDQNIVVLGVCVSDKQESYDAWRVKHKTDYSFPVAFQAVEKGKNASPVLDLYGVSGIPSTFVIDKDGKISAALVGYSGESDHRLEDALGKLGVTPTLVGAALTSNPATNGGS